jgi:hypothetical protein
VDSIARLLSKVKEDTRLFNSPVVMPLLKLTLPLFFLELFFGGANGLVVFNPAGITAGKGHEGWCTDIKSMWRLQPLNNHKQGCAQTFFTIQNLNFAIW